MNFEELSRQLGTKRRSVSDLARFVSTRTDNNPNYSLLLGAGCSINSGVRSANQLCNQWRSELYSTLAGTGAKANASVQEQREWLQVREGGWYDPSNEYAVLFEKKYDMQR